MPQANQPNSDLITAVNICDFCHYTQLPSFLQFQTLLLLWRQMVTLKELKIIYRHELRIRGISKSKFKYVKYVCIVYDQILLFYCAYVSL